MITETQREIHIVKHEHRSEPSFMRHPPHHLEHLKLVLRIERAGRLIQDKDVRLLRQGTRDEHLLAFATR